MHIKEIETLQKIGICGDTAFMSSCDFLAIEKGTIIFTPFQSCNAYIIVISGQIKVELSTKKGREITLYTINEGQTCVMTTACLLNQEDYYAKAVAQTPVKAISIPTALFKESMLAYPLFMQFVLKDFAQKTSMLFKLINNIANHDVLNNLIEYMIQHHDCLKINNSISQIAKDIGSAREVVSRKVGLLVKQGHISRNKNHIEILDIFALEQELCD